MAIVEGLFVGARAPYTGTGMLFDVVFLFAVGTFFGLRPGEIGCLRAGERVRRSFCFKLLFLVRVVVVLLLTTGAGLLSSYPTNLSISSKSIIPLVSYSYYILCT